MTGGLAGLAEQAGLDAECTSAVLRHTFGATLVHAGHDVVLVDELMGLRRLETARGYTNLRESHRPGDRERAIDGLPTGR